MILLTFVLSFSFLDELKKLNQICRIFQDLEKDFKPLSSILVVQNIPILVVDFPL